MNYIGPIADDDGADDRLSETAHVGSTVGVKVSASDPDAADTVTYTTDNDRFTVDADGTVRVAEGAHFDHETEPSISLTVTATSSDTTTSTRVFNLTVDDVNEAPVIDVVQGSGRIDNSNFAATGAGYTVTARQITDSGDLSAPSTALITHSNHGLGVVGSTGSGAPANQLGYDAGRLLSEEMIVSFDAAVASAEVGIAALWSSENGTYEVGRYDLYMNGAQVGGSDFASPTHHQGTVLQIDPGVAFDQIVFSATPYGDQGNITNNSSDYFIDAISYHSATGVAEDATTGTVAAKLVAQDPDTGDSVTLSLVDESGNVVVDGNFELVGDEIRVKAGATLDRETAGVQRVTVRATDDQGLYQDLSVDIHVLDANEHAIGAVSDADGATADRIDETAAAETPVGIRASAVDADATATVSYAVDDVRFTIAADGTVRVAAGASFDAETEPSIALTVTATSSDGSSAQQRFDIAVADINEHAIGSVSDADGATADRIDETAAAETPVGIRASAVDADATATVSYAVDDARFTIAADGTVRVAAGASFDAETEPSIALTVTATSSDGSSAQQRFDIAVADINEHAIGSVSDADGATADRIDETAGEGTLVGIRASAADADATATVSYAADDARFSIAADGTVRVAAGASFDAETEPSIALTVTATSSDGSSAVQRFDIAVADINEHAIGAVSDADGATADRIDETAAAGTLVGIRASAADADATATVSYAVDDARFTIAADGTVRVAAGASFDAETEPSIALTVTATSSDGSSAQQRFDIAVADINEHAIGSVSDADGATADRIDETAAADTLVGIRASAADADATATVSYAADDARFTIAADGTVRVAAGASFDAETEPSIALTVTATSSDGSSAVQRFDIAVADINEHAIGAVSDADGATADRIDETAAAGTLVGIRASAADADATATVSYAVDDARFTIAADGTVRVAAGASFDAETEPSIALTVTATSSDGSSAVQRFDIAVADINEHAIGSVSDADGATADRIDETAAAGTLVGIRASAADADATATVSYAVDDARFTIAADGTVRVAAGASFDAETEPSIALTVTATSSDGSSAVQRFDIAVADINEAPTWLSVSTLGVEENVAGAVVGQITVADVDDGSRHDFTVSDARFEVASGQLRLKSGVMLDYEVEPSVELHLIATDTDGLSFGRDLTINVTDVFDFAVTEFADYLVGNFTANEVDALGGDDTIIGRAGDDLLCGGAGDDRIAAGGGDDHAHGNDGNDSLKGGTGNDRLLGGAGHDTLNGGRGADVILGSWGTDLLRGKAGRDQLFGGRESDWLGGGRGRDVLFGNRGDDEVRGHVGADRLRGGHGADELHGGMGADRLNGGLGNDVLKGGKGADIMRGSSGQDLLHGGHGRDEMFGGRSADILGGGRGSDRLQGGNGDDTLKGGKGNDLLRGGNDDDQLYGGRGADRILGGIGNDTVSGGLGGDVFVFKRLRAGEVETILDFKDGIDVIELHGVAPELVRESIFDAVRDGDGDHAEVVLKGQILKFKGVNASSLSLDDFVLV